MAKECHKYGGIDQRNYLRRRAEAIARQLRTEFDMALKRNGRPPEVARPVPPSVARGLGNIARRLPADRRAATSGISVATTPVQA
jgi:hypothetical protein